MLEIETILAWMIGSISFTAIILSIKLVIKIFKGEAV